MSFSSKLKNFINGRFRFDIFGIVDSGVLFDDFLKNKCTTPNTSYFNYSAQNKEDLICHGRRVDTVWCQVVEYTVC